MSKRVSKRIIIELKSDICMGSGYSYAGIIDSDVCYDAYGIPYIPAKRIKGCFKETAESLLGDIYKDNIEKLFGVRGDKEQGNLTIGNAYIENYEEIAGFIKAKRQSGYDEYRPQRIIERFTHVVGQTKLIKGAADPTSLRYTRVVDKISPLTGKPMTFVAELSYEENDSIGKLLEAAVRGTRHIGLKRNRGLGNVICKLEPMEKPRKESYVTVEGNVIKLCVENVAPLMLSGMRDDVSEKYISGRHVLGALAGRYLKAEGKSPEDEAFKTLFLSGNVIFSNLYPYENGKVYYPAPDYLNRLKKSGDYVNALVPVDSSVSTNNGNIPKKLKNTFVSFSNNSVDVHEVSADVVYHHRHEDEEMKEILYGLTVVRPGQCFAGEIVFEGDSIKHKDILIDLLNEGDVYFGKSKSSEYGRCRLVEFAGSEKNIISSANGNCVVTFLSDAVLLKEDGSYATDYESVREAVKKELKLSEESDLSDNKHGLMNSVQMGEKSGFMSTWNLQRENVPIVKAGSYLSFEVTEESKTDVLYIGEYNLEGCGQIKIDSIEGMTYVVNKQDPKSGADVAIMGPGTLTAPDGIKKLMGKIFFEDYLETRIVEYLNSGKRVGTKLDNTQIGRLTLMLRESDEESKGNEEEAYANLKRRIESIKSDSTKAEAEKVLKLAKSFREADNDIEEKISRELQTMGYSACEIERERKALWIRYIMTLLVIRKYEGGEK